MIVTTRKTPPVVPGDALFDVLDAAIPTLDERSVVAVSSKIVAICEGSVVPMETGDKDALVRQQAERYLAPDNMYHVSLTVKNNMLIANAGIDESNGNGNYVLWPQVPQESANAIRRHLQQRLALDDVGVVIVDSKITPLRWGTTGIALSHSGFATLNDYVAQADIFGRPFAFEKANVSDGLAAAAVLVMGEGAECTPIAVITDLPFVKFRRRDPTQEELDQQSIPIDEDLYHDLLTLANWQDE
jgi:F420-0:gamma-glutamyl ligase